MTPEHILKKLRAQFLTELGSFQFFGSWQTVRFAINAITELS